MRAFLIAYGRELGTRPQIKACLNSLPEVISWRSEIPNTFFVLSEADAETLGQALLKCIGEAKPRFLVIPIQESWGWLVKDSWTFLKQTDESDKSKKALPSSE